VENLWEIAYDRMGAAFGQHRCMFLEQPHAPTSQREKLIEMAFEK